MKILFRVTVFVLCSQVALADLTTPSQHEVNEANKEKSRIEMQQLDYLSAPNQKSQRIDTSNVTQGMDSSARIDIEHTDLAVGAIFDNSTVSYGVEWSRIVKLGYYKSSEKNIARFVWGLDIPFRLADRWEGYGGLGMQLADKAIGGTRLYLEAGGTYFVSSWFIVKAGVNQIIGNDFGLVVKTGLAF